MKVATWNVNSIRTRLDHVTQWLKTNPVDMLCLQETKVVDDSFPVTAFEELGYIPYVSGQKSYNGVALVSRKPLEDVQRGFEPVLGTERVTDLDDQKRVIAGRLGEVYIINLYVPNGSSVGSEKYDYKLRWLACLKEYLAELLKTYPLLNVCGDFNIALEDKDIYNPEGKEKHIMSSPEERSALKTVLAVGLADGFRKFTDEGGHFSWWDYRAASYRRNMGWRIDHHYLSPPLYDRAKACIIDTEPRGWEKPSDHTPVIIEY
jgi:exodeoxyribonuclease-3